jgi:hypothetical protein
MTRRCGNRVEGGIYLEVPLSAYGEPIESFICDTAIIVTDDLEIPERGVVLRTGANGQQMLLDYIGENNYPNVLDFIEEVRVQGLSRRIPANFDFSQLNGEVMYCAVHKRGYVHNEPWYRQFAQANPLRDETRGISFETPWPCPRHKHTIDGTHEQPCSAVWWHDVKPGHGVSTDKTRVVMVDQPSGPPYVAMERPKEIVPIYDQAIVLILPVQKLAVIRGRDGEHDEPLKRASKTGKGVQIVVEDA